MKTAIFFDVDGTLFDNEAQKIPSNTIDLIQKLSKDERYIIGLATGRSLQQLDAIEEIKDLFKVKILINGAVAYLEDAFIYGKPLSLEDCESVLHFANRINVGIGFIGKDKHVITQLDDAVRTALKDYQMEVPEIDPLFYLNHEVYQIWVFGKSQSLLRQFKDKFPHIKLFPWHKEGADLVHKEVSKGEAIRQIKREIGANKIIAFGDGENDVEMIEMADVGVAMGNSKSQALKSKATLVTDHIALDGLYKAVIELKLL
ncbi:MAG: Cof-type HAD-IIB family hydrolase [Acholeplasma sp.]|nr:Cof-type HAD-IIB family hydrolase [Acholeplasma sp.]